ncbi:MAG: hypothetical protein R3F19_18920 [Verrucomicrobiales bacterium]
MAEVVKLASAEQKAASIEKLDRSIFEDQAEFANKVECASNDELLRLLRQNGSDPLKAVIIAEQLARSDPQGILTFLNDLGDRGSAHDEVADVLFRIWATIDMNAASAAVESLANKTLRSSASMAVLDIAFEADWGKGEALARKWCHDASNAIPAPDWVRDQPERAAKFAMTLPVSTFREMALGWAGKYWALEDPAAALQWSDGIFGLNRETLQRTIVNSWAKSDIVSAQSEFMTMKNSELKKAFGSSIVKELVRQHSLQSAIEWADENVDQNRIPEAISSIFQTAALAEPGVAAAQADLIVDKALRQCAVGAVASTWAMQDLPAAIDWALGQPGAELRKHAMDRLSYSWVATDVTGAANYASNAAPEEISTHFAGQIVNKLIESDGAAAIDFAVKLPGDQGDALIWRALEQLSQRDGRAAAELVTKNAGRISHRGVETVSNRFFESSFDGGERWADWIESLPQGAGRRTAVEAVSNYSLNKKLTPEIRERVVQAIANP